jgi:Na+-translocating ferredoxin:NAD+ oxidoreductase RnfG subunit
VSTYKEGTQSNVFAHTTITKRAIINSVYDHLHAHFTKLVISINVIRENAS